MQPKDFLPIAGGKPKFDGLPHQKWSIFRDHEWTAWTHDDSDPKNEGEFPQIWKLGGIRLHLQHGSGKSQQWQELEGWLLHGNQQFQEDGPFWPRIVNIGDWRTVLSNLQIFLRHHEKRGCSHNFRWRSRFDCSSEKSEERWRIWRSTSVWLLSHSTQPQEEPPQKAALGSLQVTFVQIDKGRVRREAEWVFGCCWRGDRHESTSEIRRQLWKVLLQSDPAGVLWVPAQHFYEWEDSWLTKEVYSLLKIFHSYCEQSDRLLRGIGGQMLRISTRNPPNWEPVQLCCAQRS